MALSLCFIVPLLSDSDFLLCCAAIFTCWQDAARVAAPTIPGVRRVRLNTVEKKQIKTVKMINSMLEAASTLPFECTEGGAVSREVALILGNTHTNPREVYLLRFSGSQCPPAADLAKVQGNAVRAVMRTLMMSLSTARSLGRSRISCRLILISRGAALTHLFSLRRA